MAVEKAPYVNSLNPEYPTQLDSVSEGDDHIRLIKEALVATFPNLDSAVTLTPDEFSQLQDKLKVPGVVASCKYNGDDLRYTEGVTAVSNGWEEDNPDGLAPGGYKVYFDSKIPEFDAHYAPIVTLFPAVDDEGVGAYPCVVALQAFYDDSVEFTVHQIGGPENGGAPENPVGFSLLIVDMEDI